MTTVVDLAELGIPARVRAEVGAAPITVTAGFPSPAQDYHERRLDLNEWLITDTTCTFIVRVAGRAMEPAGISDGDELVVDRSLKPHDGSVIIAVLDGELAVRRLRLTRQGVVLHADHPKFPDVVVTDLSELTIWGVVTRCLHKV